MGVQKICRLSTITTPQGSIPSHKATAEHLHISPGYLSRRFLHEVGTSYNTYLTDQKLAFARKRLQLGFTVTEVAEEAGFTSPSYFIQLYKKIRASARKILEIMQKK